MQNTSFCFAAVKNYFQSSCVPGANPNSKLCQLCKGGCSRSHKEPYYDYAGAFQSVLQPFLLHRPINVPPVQDQLLKAVRGTLCSLGVWRMALEM